MIRNDEEATKRRRDEEVFFFEAANPSFKFARANDFVALLVQRDRSPAISHLARVVRYPGSTRDGSAG
jgi:hypothetical protein